MDSDQFDALARHFGGICSRRQALAGVLGSALGIVPALRGEGVAAHDNWSRCKNIADKKKRKKCEKKGAAHKKWHETHACRGEGQKCGDRPCCGTLACQSGYCEAEGACRNEGESCGPQRCCGELVCSSDTNGTCGQVLGCGSGDPPGGVWISPAAGFQAEDGKIAFAAHAYPAAGVNDRPVSHVNFTGLPEGGDWTILCADSSPAAGTDRYSCVADFKELGIPYGPITVGFDVYDECNHRLSPNGKRQGCVCKRGFHCVPDLNICRIDAIAPLSQQNGSWASMPLGFSTTTTIGSHGCTITGIAMILDTTPDVVNDKLKAANAFDVNLIRWPSLGAAFPGVTAHRYSSFNNTDVQMNLPCLVEVDGSSIGNSQHWVVYIGNDRMLDPWYGDEASISRYPTRTGYAVLSGTKYG